MKYTTNLRIDGNRVISYTTHVATIDHAAGTLTVHGHWSSTTSKHVNRVADEYGLRKVDGNAPEQASKSNGGMLAAVAMVAKFGELLTSNQKESNDWKLRMMKAGLSNRGLMIPDDWDQLSEAEKTARLDKALAVIS